MIVLLLLTCLRAEMLSVLFIAGPLAQDSSWHRKGAQFQCQCLKHKYSSANKMYRHTGTILPNYVEKVISKSREGLEMVPDVEIYENL